MLYYIKNYDEEKNYFLTNYREPKMVRIGIGLVDNKSLLSFIAELSKR
ncbi:hypothetical protein [Acidilutibacter cellobiosedens]|nr:hypothetical protein [Acidilutibacter cellobiosedens]